MLTTDDVDDGFLDFGGDDVVGYGDQMNVIAHVGPTKNTFFNVFFIVVPRNHEV